ncbi:hypothetical protein [Lysinibacillus sp. ACHW1.5]|uniref:hypothetical protein n=1 Tax=Lysinibacillus sp. ACHW1.5 TaxID=2913506 RepID=UPI001EDB528C|nr:hypothetical protein [Lysinibacillus sp. ACHW1.5]UKJ44302.1 hypothetical protein L6W14_16245 [Lysinibacillus sp. ACHW1.5]
MKLSAELEKRIQECFIKANLTDIELKVSDEERYEMCYSLDEHSIYYNVETLRNDLKEDFNDIDFEDYFIIILCHEIGHALDENLEKNHMHSTKLWDKIQQNLFAKTNKKFLNDIKNNAIQNEKNAWNKAAQIIDESMKMDFEKVMEKSLKDAIETANMEMELMTLKIRNAELEIKNLS